MFYLLSLLLPVMCNAFFFNQLLLDYNDQAKIPFLKSFYEELSKEAVNLRSANLPFFILRVAISERTGSICLVLVHLNTSIKRSARHTSKIELCRISPVTVNLNYLSLRVLLSYFVDVGSFITKRIDLSLEIII